MTTGAIATASLVVVLVLLLGGTDASQLRPFVMRDALEANRISSLAVSPNGRTLAWVSAKHSVQSRDKTSSLWTCDNVADAVPQPLTNATTEHGDSAPAFWSDSVVVFLRSGQLWSINLMSGQAQQMTDFPVDVGSFRVHPSTSRVFFSVAVFASMSMEETKQRLEAVKNDPSTGSTFDGLYIRHWDTWEDGRVNHLFVAKLDDKLQLTGTPIDLMPGSEQSCPMKPFGGSGDYDVSPDGRSVAYAAHVGGHDEAWSTNSHIYLTEVDSPGSQQRLSADLQAYATHPTFSPDGDSVAYLGMTVPKFEADKNRIWLTNTSSSSANMVTDAIDKSFDSISWSPSGESLVATSQWHGRVVVSRVALDGSESVIMTGSGVSDVGIVDEDAFVCLMSSAVSPPAVYSYQSTLLLVHDANQELQAEVDMSPAEEVWFTGAMGEDVHGWLFKPFGFDPDANYPMVLLVHGGPQSAWMDSWSTRWNYQAFAGAGFVVFAVNFHGSTGYGQQFTDSITGQWGSYPYQDLMDGVDHVLQEYPFIDGDRLTAAGGSYGGFMVNYLAGQDRSKTRFKALVSHSGIFDVKMMYYTTEEVFFVEFENGNEPEYDNPDAFQKWNPSNNVDQWTTPTLIVHGALDFRIPDTQSFSVLTALQRRGVPSKLLHFPDENHWILKAPNSQRWYTEVLDWLNAYAALAKKEL